MVRLAESEDAVIFARVDEAEKCEFIKANAPEEAWTSTDDGAGLLVKASGLREQARAILVSAERSRTSPLSQPVMGPYGTSATPFLPCLCPIYSCRESHRPPLLAPPPPHT